MAVYRAVPWDILQQLFKTEKINNHVLHFSCTCRTALSIIRLKQAVSLLSDSFPLIHCNLCIQRGKPVWYDKGYTPDGIVSIIETDNAASEQNNFLMQEIDELHGPQMKIALIKTAGKDSLCVIINHMLCDAAGFKEILYRLASLYTELEEGTAVKNDSMMADRTVAQISKYIPLKKRVGMYLRQEKLSVRGKQRFSFEGCLSTPFIERRTVSKDMFMQIKKYAAEHKATVNDVFTAVCIRILTDIFGKPDTLPCAIDVRRFLPGGHASGVCNLVITIPCTIGKEIPGTFAETVARVKGCMDIRKNDPACLKSLIMLENLFNTIPYAVSLPILKKVFHNPPVSFTNIGILDKQKLAFGTTDMADAFMTGSVKYPDYFQLSVSTFDGKVECCVNLYGTDNDRRIIASFLDALMNELGSVCAEN
jgi:NRPS condensation-like uncharacterized protein